MADETIRQTAERIGEYVRGSGIIEFRIVLHGGEPLMVGAKGLTFIVETLRAALPDGVKMDIIMQTNGTLLPRLIDTLDEFDIRVGVSLDGDEKAQNRFRRYADGRSSFKEVEAALELLNQKRYRHLYAGILCVFDLQDSPLNVYEALIKHDPPAIDLLFKLANHENPPERPDEMGPTPYADWLIPIFDKWYWAPDSTTKIRLFQRIMDQLSWRSDRTGIYPGVIGAIVVNSDGSLGLLDALNSVYEGAGDTGYNVFDHTIEDAMRYQEDFVVRMGATKLHPTCMKCPLRSPCNRGYWVHGWDGQSFSNPSVYCRDLKKLIRHIKRCLADDDTQLEARR